MIPLQMGAKGRLVARSRSGEIVVAESTRHAVTFAQRFKGLLFSDQLSGALIIHKCQAVHMMFMRYSIDVLFADRDGNVLKCISNLKPWRCSPFVKDAYFAVELPAGTIAKYQLTSDMVLSIVSAR